MELSHRDLRTVSMDLVSAREDERSNIARELHDDLGQRLAALKMELSDVIGDTMTASQKARITKMIRMVDDAVVAVRRMTRELRPLMLEGRDLGAAIELLVQESRQRMGIEIDLHLDDVVHEVNDDVTVAIYRMVQESMTNIFRHARATRARIDIREQGDGLLLTVQDDGVGLNHAPSNPRHSHGLAGISERAHMLGGWFEAGETSPTGSRITVCLPLAAIRKVS